MGGFFGTISTTDCVSDLYYGTDYHSHMGTKRGGLAVVNDNIFTKAIHSLENSYFRTKFEPELSKFSGKSGIGVISDTESQPIIINSHLGKFAIVTVSKIANIQELTDRALQQKLHFAEAGSGKTSPSELIAMLINEKDSIEEGIENAQNLIKGSCSLLVLTNNGIYASRDKLGRTPIILGKKDGAMAACFESSSLSNLGFEIEHYMGPGEIIFLTADKWEQKHKPNDKMQVCSFLWVYYGYPSSYYEGINVEEVRYVVVQL